MNKGAFGWLSLIACITSIMCISFFGCDSGGSGGGTVEDTTPPVISDISSTTTETTATITWKTDENSDSKVEYGKTTSYGMQSSNTEMVTSHSIQLTGLESGTTYHYKVTSSDAANNKGDSADATFTTNVIQDTNPPVAPSGLAAQAGDGQVILTWNANVDSDLAGYHIYRSLNMDSGFTRLNTTMLPTSSSPTYTDTDVTNGTEYFYTVSAVDDSDNESEVSAKVSATPKKLLGDIQVTSTPSGAAIYIDGEDTGEVTPYTFTDKDVGSYVITVSLTNYSSSPPSVEVQVTDGGTANANFTLTMDTGTLAVTSTPAGARIFIDGQNTLYDTPYTFTNYALGNYTVSVTLEGYTVDPGPMQVTVEAGKTATANFTLTEILGTLEVTSIPAGADIFLNGQDSGQQTPYTFEDQEAGTYSIFLKLDGYNTPYYEYATVTNNQETQVSVNLTAGAAELPMATKVLNQDTLDELDAVSVDKSTVTFSASTPELDFMEAGDIIAIGITSETPEGLLRKVTSISTSGGSVILQTGPASLEEAITNGSLDISRSISQVDTNLDNLVLYDADGSEGTTNDQAVLDGTVSTTIDITFNLEIAGGELDQLDNTCAVELEESLDLNTTTAATGINASQNAAIYSSFEPEEYLIGIFPVVLTPEMIITANMYGAISAGISSDITVESSINTGFEYSGGTFSNVGTHSTTFTNNQPELTTDCNIKAGAGYIIYLKVYGEDGSYHYAGSYLDLEADITAEPWWELYGTLEASSNNAMLIYTGVNEKEDFDDLIDYRTELDQAYINQAPTACFSVDPTSGNTNSFFMFDASCSNDTEDGTNLEYRWDLDNDGTWDVSWTTTATHEYQYSTADTYTIVLEVRDSEGKTDSTTIDLDVAEGGTVDQGVMTQIPAGDFVMGDTFGEIDSSTLPTRTVYLDAYWIGVHEVTFDNYDDFCEATGRTKPDNINGLPRSGRPVINISWEDAAGYCNWLSRQKGLTECYDDVTWECDFTADGYRLPTEAEWEKAAAHDPGLTGNKKRRYPWGDTWSCSLLNSLQCGPGQPVVVWNYPSGASYYGLYNMAGNVAEWCNDYWSANYQGLPNPDDNPTGPSTGSKRLLRGGHWSSNSTECLSAFRSGVNPSNATSYIGFRIARSAN